MKKRAIKYRRPHIPTRQADKRDYKLILMWFIIALILVLSMGQLRAETILSYEVCRGDKCINDQAFSDDADFFSCRMHGQQIIVKENERKARQGYVVRRWTCTLGKRTVSL